MRTAIVVCAILGFPGCALAPMPSPESTSNEPVPSNAQQEADEQQYSALQAKLDARRLQFMAAGSGSSALTPVGSQLYWLDSNTYDGSLHRFDHSTGKRIDYTLPIGGTQNYGVSTTIIVTADDGTGLYHVYDASQPDAQIGQTMFDEPSNAQYWAYAVDGDTAYVVVDETPGQTTLYTWQAPWTTPVAVTTLEEATGSSLGEFENLGVQGDTVVFVEGGRVWWMSLSTKKAVWTGNTIEADSTIDFMSRGLLFSTGDDPGSLEGYDATSMNLSALSDAIANSPYLLNGTYAGMQVWSGGDYAAWNSWAVYCNDSGVFGYNASTGAIVPVLLVPSNGDAQINYVQPTILDDGTLFVTGLVGGAGSEGVDGPLWEVPLAGLLE